MPDTTAAEDVPAVNQPRHRLQALTTFELRDYRCQLERAIAYFEARNSVPSARADLQARLEAVLAEYDDRIRLCGS